MIAELKRLLGEAMCLAPWRVHKAKCWHHIKDARGQFVAQNLFESDAALIVALRNNAEALLAVCEAAERLVAEWEVPDCDCPAEGHICGWPKVIALKMALARLKEGKG